MKLIFAFNKTAIIAIYFSGLINSPSFSHSCIYPEVTFDTLSPGVVRKISCFIQGGFRSCSDTTTFRESDLLLELHTKFAIKKFAIRGNFASVTRELILDTTFYDTTGLPPGGIKYDINNFMDETVTIQVDDVIKGGFSKPQLIFPHKWFYNEESTLVAKWDTILDSISYDPAQGKRFIAFFDEYDSISQLGFEPTVDCFFVVSGYFIEGDRIRKTGAKGAHGISVSLEDFMKVLSIKHQFNFNDYGSIQRNRLHTIFQPHWMNDTEFYNLLGRRRPFFTNRRKNAAGSHEPGIYFLKEP